MHLSENTEDKRDGIHAPEQVTWCFTWAHITPTSGQFSEMSMNTNGNTHLHILTNDVRCVLGGFSSRIQNHLTVHAKQENERKKENQSAMIIQELLTVQDPVCHFFS